jgi:myo-inositol 2-dehydrogenase/D-chiro-inositol 1-dehydrogenase
MGRRHACGNIGAHGIGRQLHLCEIRPDRLAEVKKLYKPATATLDYNDIIKNDNISVVYISTTPESNHYPICRDCLKSGKNVMLEKPIALELWEADELIQLAKRNNLKFTIGYSSASIRKSPSQRRRSSTARSARWSPCW